MAMTMLYHVQVLKNILSKRQKEDAKYSLRKFAQNLDISPTTLSHILTQKKGLSEALASSIADKLKLNETERDMFLLSVSSAHSRNSKVKLESTLELAERRKRSTSRNQRPENKNEILIEKDKFHIETQEVQDLVSRTQVHAVYRYFSKKSEISFRILYILKDIQSGNIIKDFIQVTFNEKTKQSATVYFIEKPNGRFKTYFNNVFDGIDRVTGFVPENQNTEIKFDKDNLPTIPLIRFLVLGENKHIIGKMKYTQTEFTVQGTLIELDQPDQSRGSNYNLKLFRL